MILGALFFFTLVFCSWPGSIFSFLFPFPASLFSARAHIFDSPTSDFFSLLLLLLLLLLFYPCAIRFIIIYPPPLFFLLSSYLYYAIVIFSLSLDISILYYRLW
mgnify:CR=1 FL=1